MTAPPTHLLAARDRRPGPPLGHCPDCSRPYFSKGVARARGLVESGGDGYCGMCSKWRANNPGRSPEEVRAEPQERVIKGGYWWRRLAVCRGTSPLFDSPDIPDDDVPGHLRAAALIYCAQCPVRRECTAEADAHEYEGLFGGILRIRRLRRRGSYIRCYDLLDAARRPYVLGADRSGGSA